MSLPGLIVEVAYTPSGLLGGDCFDSFELDKRWILSMFDPMMHGVKAAMNSMLLRAELQRWVALTAEPARCLQWINSELALLGISDLYVTAVIASWFPRTQTLVYASAGEHPPLILHEGKIRNLSETAGGLPLGITTTEHYTESIRQMKTGDRVFFFTDGVGEAIGRESASPVAARSLSRRIEETATLPLPEQMNAILAHIPFEPFDDILLVGCEVT
jgi:serine phosphatase RsbU (regulator of sigma subunit)